MLDKTTQKLTISTTNLKRKLDSYKEYKYQLLEIKPKKRPRIDLVFERYILSEDQWLLILSYKDIIHDILQKLKVILKGPQGKQQVLTKAILSEFFDNWDLIKGPYSYIETSPLNYIVDSLYKHGNQECVLKFINIIKNSPRDFSGILDNFIIKFQYYLTSEDLNYLENFGFYQIDFENLKTKEEIENYFNIVLRSRTPLDIISSRVEIKNQEVIKFFIRNNFAMGSLLDKIKFNTEIVDYLLESPYFKSNNYSISILCKRLLSEISLTKNQIIKILTKIIENSNFSSSLIINLTLLHNLLFYIDPITSLGFLTSSNPESRDIVKIMKDLNDDTH